ncbi:DUF4402 domain-containing protein [uncultured Phenylobacterium sp.]|uniref:DUF4402 domain-containing protein n=1 Tax=uncultured Phenylobacterium sp. TaxID=349273 RepID=UPI0025D9D8F6|nr:DUF4402 domain-containing protein [uncultured Phenylobacterium sp.]
MTRLLVFAGTVAAAALAAVAAAAAAYTVNVTGPMDLQQVSAAATGDTVFRISPATGSVTVQSGGGSRISTASARSQVTVICRPSRSGDTDCTTRNVAMRIGRIGQLTGRARPLAGFTVAMGTATLTAPPTGVHPIAFELAPLGANSAKTFFVGADFGVAGDESGLATGNSENGFYAYIVDANGLQLGGDTDKGKVKVFRALSIAKTADLNFGRIQIPASGASTVTLNASNGNRTVTGSGFGYPTPAPTRAAFTVSGEGGQQFSLSIPATLVLTGPGSLTVNLTDTAPNAPSLAGGLGSAGTYSFTVGGSFSLTNATPTGAYAGVLTVSLDYN